MTQVDHAPLVTVVVVARNEERNIAACIHSLALQDYSNVHVILVDDGSTDATVERAKVAYADLEVVSSPTRSISKNRNVGWQRAASEFVAYLDADCEAPTWWIATLMRAAFQTRAAAVGGGNKPPSDESRHYAALGVMLNTYAGSRGSIQGKLPERGQFVPHLPGLNVLYRRDALQLVGGFDERFARMGEDEDLSRRLGYLGLRLYVVPDATVIHRQRAHVSSWAKNMRRYGRGRSAMLRRHPNSWSPLFLLPPLTIPLFPLYLPLIATYALGACARRRCLRLWPHVVMLFIVTHVSYGVGQLEAMFLHEDGDTIPVRRRRIALLALKNAGNKGDEAIAKCVSERLSARREETGYTTDIYLAALGPSGFDVRPLPEVPDARDRLIRDLLAPISSSRTTSLMRLLADGTRCLRVFASFHAIVIAGGQWLHDLSMAKHIIMCGLFGLARVCGTATGAFCVGIGPLKRRVSRLMIRTGFGADALLIARDVRSTELLHLCGFSQAQTATDPALELTTVEVKTVPGRVLLSPCAWVSFENIYALHDEEIASSLKSWRQLIAGVLARGFHVAILPTMNPEDSIFSKRISAGFEGVDIIDAASLTPAEVQGHIAAAHALVSMRLHPIIFASNCRVPFIALNYADKVRAYCEQSACEHWLVELGPNWAEEVLEKFDALPKQRHSNTAAPARAEQRSRLETAYSELLRWLGLVSDEPPACNV